MCTLDRTPHGLGIVVMYLRIQAKLDSYNTYNYCCGMVQFSLQKIRGYTMNNLNDAT